MITHHAQQRVQERFGVAADRAEAVLARLWKYGRPANGSDFIAFGAARLPDKAYRVSDCGNWMIVRSLTTDKFITVIPRRG